jgi:hypothetical protein
MSMKTRCIPGLALGVSFTLVMAVAGCSGDPGMVTAVPASGTVKFDGKPLESGSISFVPEKGRPASGAIKDGKFTMTTYTENDGAIPGKHAVAVTSYKEVQIRGASEPQQVPTIPEIYLKPTTSGIAIDVPPGGKTDIAIDLKK